jgi:hypothetical protein
MSKNNKCGKVFDNAHDDDVSSEESPQDVVATAVPAVTSGNRRLQKRSTVPVRLSRSAASKIYSKALTKGQTLTDQLEEEIRKAEKFERLLREKESEVYESGSLKDIVEFEKDLTTIHELRRLRQSSPLNSTPMIANNSQPYPPEFFDFLKLFFEKSMDSQMAQKLFEERSKALALETENKILHRMFEQRPKEDDQSELVKSISRSVAEYASKMIEEKLNQPLGDGSKTNWICKFLDKCANVAQGVIEKAQLSPPAERRIVFIPEGESQGVEEEAWKPKNYFDRLIAPKVSNPSKVNNSTKKGKEVIRGDV